MKNLSYLILAFVLITSCVNEKKVDFTKEKSEILKLHNAQRDYHFNKDSIAFANQFSDAFIGVGNGMVSTQKKEDRISRYHKYFSAVEFIKWDDVSEPIIEFSDDGSLAYSIVDKIVNFTYKDQSGEIVQVEIQYAWTAIYRKYDEVWKIVSVTSTEKPPSD